MKSKSLTRKWWFWLLAVIFFPFAAIYGMYRCVINYRESRHKRWLISIIPLGLLTLIGFISYAAAFSGNKTTITAPKASSSLSSVKASSSTKKQSLSNIKQSTKASASSSSSSVRAPIDSKDVLEKLMTYTNSESAGPTKNYYWNNGTANLSGFDLSAAGDTRFSSDNQGRSTAARAILTYAEYETSKGSRQGNPLAPPSWPTSNPQIAISFSLTGKVYHGYLYNRSHSIADSLLGAKSYVSQYNFTTGTRSQNVGADQNGGMRAAEELAENYWKAHAGSKATIDYQTTPIYNGSETIPRGSIVDEKSSDGLLNVEIVVINDAEGIQIDYNSGSENQATPSNNASSSTATSPTSTAKGSDRTVYVASNGTSNVYWYDENAMPSTTNKNNVKTMTEAEAIAVGKHLDTKGE